jgi:hypothetical protein
VDLVVAALVSVPPVPAHVQSVVEQALNFEPPLPDSEAYAQSLVALMADWPLEKLIKEYEALTGRKYIPSQTTLESMRSCVVQAVIGATAPLSV